MSIRQVRVTDESSRHPHTNVPFIVEGELTHVDDRTPPGQGPWQPLDYFPTQEQAEARAAEYRTALAEEAARIAEMNRRILAGEFDSEPEQAEYCWECGLPIKPGEGIIDALGWAHRSCVGA